MLISLRVVPLVSSTKSLPDLTDNVRRENADNDVISLT